MNKFANLEINGKNLKIPLIEGSENEIALDISKLRSETDISQQIRDLKIPDQRLAILLIQMVKKAY